MSGVGLTSDDVKDHQKCDANIWEHKCRERSTMILDTLEWWLLPPASWTLSFHSDTFLLGLVFLSLSNTFVMLHSHSNRTLVKFLHKLDLHSLLFLFLIFFLLFVFALFHFLFLNVSSLFYGMKKLLIISNIHVNTMHTFVIITHEWKYFCLCYFKSFNLSL